MGSLRLPISLHKPNSNHSIMNPSNPTPTTTSSYIHVRTACTITNTITRVTIVKDPFEREKKRIAGSKKIRWDRELESVFINSGEELDVDYSVIRSDFGLEQCNSVLKRLESSFSDTKALRFFDWMRINGKLEGNVLAYNSIFRVLGRRQDWDAAERLLEELKRNPGCDLNYQIFNTLIFSCAKLGRADLGSKWFRSMISHGIEPNVATFGMVMGLYRKSWNAEEAEFAFSRMRASKITDCCSAYSAMITIYTRLSLYEKAEEVIELARRDGVVFDSDIWLATINAFSQQGKLEEAEEALVSMRREGFSPNIVAYNTLITGYGKAGKMEEATRVFESVESLGLGHDETSFRSMLEGWGRVGNYEEVSRIYRKLKDSGFKPNSSNLFTMIHLQVKNGDEEGTARTLGEMLETGCQASSIVGVLVRAYEKFERVDKIPSVLKGSLFKHVLSSQSSCSVVVMAYVRNGLVGEAIHVLKEKTWKDSSFEDNLYHLLICSCKDTARLENAVEIYSHMPRNDKDKKPNMHVACSMIDIYGLMGRFKEAEELYLELKSYGVSLDVIGYTIVLRMYVKSGSLSEACSVADEVEIRDELSPDIHLIRDMFRVYQRCDEREKLSRLYYKVLKSKSSWDRETYNCVINCCSKALPVDEISGLFDDMTQKGFVPNTVTVNVLLHIYGKSKLFRKAKKLFWLADKWGIVDVISYNTLVDAYAKNNELKKMSSTAKLMEFKGFSVSLEAYTSMLNAYGKENQMERFKSVLEQIKESKCASNSRYTYNIMINIYGERGWIEEVSGVLAELRECGLGPDICSYNTMIKAYGIAGLVGEAVGIVKEMRENGVEPDKITYVNLIAAARRNDEFLEAVKWSLWMKQMGL